MKHRHLEVFAVLSTPCLVAWALYLSASGCDFVGVFAALVGYVIADFFCGAIHWYCDERANESWKWIGPSFIRPFRDHHLRPEALTGHDIFELCGNNAIVCSSIIAVTIPWAQGTPHLAIGVLAFALAVLATNVFHKWAHTSAPPSFVRALQKLRVVLSPEEHLQHHVLLDRAYCVTSGWTNGILDAAIRRVRARDRRN
jgi:ubiquitin-conjugating enzyme E2 variant